MYVASKKTNIYSILLASYLLENTQNDILRLWNAVFASKIYSHLLAS